MHVGIITYHRFLIKEKLHTPLYADLNHIFSRSKENEKM